MVIFFDECVAFVIKKAAFKYIDFLANIFAGFLPKLDLTPVQVNRAAISIDRQPFAGPISEKMAFSLIGRAFGCLVKVETQSQVSLQGAFHFIIKSYYYYQKTIAFLSQLYNISLKYMLKTSDMIYRNLGNSGLQVSVIGFGTWTNTQTSYEETKALVAKCLSSGVNLFDLAESYGEGAMQEKIGKIFKELNVPRQQLVISTKIWKSREPSLNSNASTNLKHIKQGVKESLKRLQLDYVDVLMAHNFDENTPIEETCRGFHEAVQQGLTFYWGMSNWESWNIFKALQICYKNKWHLPIVAQNQYNMLYRKQIEEQLRKLLEVYNFGLMAYSPLCGGYLTGKYLSSNPESGRFIDNSTSNVSRSDLTSIYLGSLDIDKVQKCLLEIKQIAQKQLGGTLAQLAIAWAINFKYTSTALVGARNTTQLDTTLDAIKLLKKLNPELQGRINQILGSHPKPRTEWKSMSPQNSLRPLKQ